VSITLVHHASSDKNCLQDFAQAISKWEFFDQQIAARQSLAIETTWKDPNPDSNAGTRPVMSKKSLC
jgi:hypothetical protein